MTGSESLADFRLSRFYSGGTAEAKELKKFIGRRLSRFVEVMKRIHKIDDLEFCRQAGIHESLLKLMRQGELFPGVEDLANLYRIFGLNTTWLYTGRGNMHEKQ